MSRDLVATALALTALGCEQRGALDPGSREARALETLWWTFFWPCLLVFVAVMAALAAAVARGRARREARGEQSELAPDHAVERGMERAVVLSTATSGAILVGLLVASLLVGRELFRTGAPDRVVRITGHQWWWEVQYPNPRSDLIVTTANEVHVAAGQTVRLELASADVIHSLWFPNLHGKRDLVPGRINDLTLTPDRPGRYVGRCAEFCGLGHARMDLVMVVHTEEELARWLTDQRKPAKDPTEPLARRGAELFACGPCALCHSITGTPASGSLGPDLTHVAGRRAIAGGSLPNTPDALARWIRDPQRIKPAAQMPPSGFSEDEVAAVVRYLGTLE